MTFAMTIDEIIALYPAPTKAVMPGLVPGRYCVGGALCLALLGTDAVPYPSGSHLACQLREINPALSEEDAQGYARDIIEANDAGNFPLAWQIAGAFLAEIHTRKPKRSAEDATGPAGV